MTKITEEEIATEIRLEVRFDQGVEMTEKEVLGYMENPESYDPPAVAIEKFIAEMKELRKKFPSVVKEGLDTVEHAIHCLRSPFTKQSRANFEYIARARRDERAARHITEKDLAKRFNAPPPR